MLSVVTVVGLGIVFLIGGIMLYAIFDLLREGFKANSIAAKYFVIGMAVLGSLIGLIIALGR